MSPVERFASRTAAGDGLRLRRSGWGGLALLALFAFTAPSAAAFRGQFLCVPPDDPVYDDLEQFRALGLWEGSLELRPLTRAEVARAIRTVLEQSAASRSTGATDRAGSTVDAAAPSGAAVDAVRRERLRRLLRAWGAEGGVADEATDSLRLDVTAAVRTYTVASGLDSLADLDRRRRREHLVSLCADAAVSERFVAQWRLYEDYARQSPYRESRGWADNLPSGFRKAFTDASAGNDRAVLGLGWRWGDLRVGREDRRWGVGRRGTLFLSENAFPLDGISLRVRTRRVSGASLFAQLRRGGKNLPPDAFGPVAPPDVLANDDAWLAAHRIEVRPLRSLRLGLYEAVAYGGRGIDLGYLNPAALLVAVTQDLDHRARVDDKKVLGFDLSADVASATVYGEFLVNRVISLDVATKGDSTEISSYAQLVGLRWAEPLRLRGTSLDLEYAHLDPEVYFHHDGDPGRALLHEGEIIGHWLGPNADDVHLSFGLPPHRRFGDLRLACEQARWGIINGRRGTELGYAGLVRRQKKWITGRKEIERVYSVEWTRRDLPGPFGTRLDGEMRLARVESAGVRRDRGWQAELRLAWRGALTLRDPVWP